MAVRTRTRSDGAKSACTFLRVVLSIDDLLAIAADTQSVLDPSKTRDEWYDHFSTQSQDKVCAMVHKNLNLNYYILEDQIHQYRKSGALHPPDGLLYMSGFLGVARPVYKTPAGWAKILTSASDKKLREEYADRLLKALRSSELRPTSLFGRFASTIGYYVRRIRGITKYDVGMVAAKQLSSAACRIQGPGSKSCYVQTGVVLGEQAIARAPDVWEAARATYQDPRDVASFVTGEVYERTREAAAGLWSSL